MRALRRHLSAEHKRTTCCPRQYIHLGPFDFFFLVWCLRVGYFILFFLQGLSFIMFCPSVMLAGVGGGRNSRFINSFVSHYR